MIVPLYPSYRRLLASPYTLPPQRTQGDAHLTVHILHTFTAAQLLREPSDRGVVGGCGGRVSPPAAGDRGAPARRNPPSPRRCLASSPLASPRPHGFPKGGALALPVCAPRRSPHGVAARAPSRDISIRLSPRSDPIPLAATAAGALLSRFINNQYKTDSLYIVYESPSLSPLALSLSRLSFSSLPCTADIYVIDSSYRRRRPTPYFASRPLPPSSLRG